MIKLFAFQQSNRPHGISMTSSTEQRHCVGLCCVDLLVDVVVELVVAPQGGQAPLADGEGEEHLGPGVHPHLSSKHT